jgi:hypothetical protein
MNVAVTRARCHVALVADAATVGAHPFLRRLLIHATDAGGGAVCVRDAAQGTAPWSDELRAVAEARRTGSHRIATNRVYRYGPSPVRDAKDMKTALATLAERRRARLVEDGRRRFVEVNPILLGG